MERKDAFERALDVIIDEAVENCCENEIDESWCEREFSETHEKKMKKLFRQVGLRDCMHSTWQCTKRVACVAVGITVLIGVSVCSVEAWRKNFVNFFYDEDARNSQYNYNDLGGEAYADDKLRLNYIPYGFESVNQNISEHSYVNLFEKDDLYFTVSLTSMKNQGTIDTENATVSRIDFDDCEAVLVEKETANRILWQDGEIEIQIAGNINSAEIIKIGKNLKKY